MTSEKGKPPSPHDSAVSHNSTDKDHSTGDPWPSPAQPMKVARLIAGRRTVDGVCLYRRWRGDWLEWVGSKWEPMEDAAVRKLLYSTLEDAVYINPDFKSLPWSPTRHKIANVTEALASVTHLPETISPPAWVDEYGADARQLVSVKNGILSSKNRLLVSHDPHFFNLVSVPFDYEPDAPEPEKWLTFLDELWGDDDESILALQQFFGYILSGRTDLHKILLLVGPSRAGKGVIARVLGALVGKGNVAGPTLSSLGTNFGLQPLIGKPLAIISDARLGRSTGVSVIVERLLSISGEDWLTIDRKYKAPWSGKLNTRFMVVSNELPRFGDASGAIANRFILLALRRSWLGRENPQLTDQLLTELPGILNWALEGMDAVHIAGRFVDPVSSREAIAALQDLTSPVSAFVRDECVVGANHEVPKDDLWKAWAAWCESGGRHKGSKATFGRDLLAAYPMVTSHRPREEDHRIHTYQGVGLFDPQWKRPLTDPDLTEKSTLVTDGQGDQALSSEHQTPLGSRDVEIDGILAKADLWAGSEG